MSSNSLDAIRQAFLIVGGLHEARLDPKVLRPETEALFISCSNLRTLDIIDALERESGKPVVTSNQAAMWGTLRKIGDKRAVPGAGRLFRDA